jgi:hypothetical protein
MRERISKRRRSLAKAGVVAAAAPILNALLGRAVHAADDTPASNPDGAWYAHTSDTRVVARSNRMTFRDLGFSWNLSGKNGNYSTFLYSPS